MTTASGGKCEQISATTAPLQQIPMTCEECSGEVDNKNAAGHFRELCLDCIQDEAQRTTHIQTCERTECPVCDSWLQETKEWVHTLYIATRIRQARRKNQNYRLNQFK